MHMNVHIFHTVFSNGDEDDDDWEENNWCPLYAWLWLLIHSVNHSHYIVKKKKKKKKKKTKKQKIEKENKNGKD